MQLEKLNKAYNVMRKECCNEAWSISKLSKRRRGYICYYGVAVIISIALQVMGNEWYLVPYLPFLIMLYDIRVGKEREYVRSTVEDPFEEKMIAVLESLLVKYNINYKNKSDLDWLIKEVEKRKKENLILNKISVKDIVMMIPAGFLLERMLVFPNEMVCKNLLLLCLIISGLLIAFNGIASIAVDLLNRDSFHYAHLEKGLRQLYLKGCGFGYKYY